MGRSANMAPCCEVRSHQRSPYRGAEANLLTTADTTARINKPAVLLIPAAVAFGTGEHVTTAMSLRFLEELTRQWKCKWSLVDLGTGSGILALAAKRFGASRVLGIDNDPTAVSMARSNARLNKIFDATFRLADVRKWKSARNTNVATANLYSDLLIKILPKLKRSRWLILSGILRSQENEFLRALRRNQIEIVRAKRRGKWIAVLGKSGASW